LVYFNTQNGIFSVCKSGIKGIFLVIPSKAEVRLVSSNFVKITWDCASHSEGLRLPQPEAAEASTGNGSSRPSGLPMSRAKGSKWAITGRGFFASFTKDQHQSKKQRTKVAKAIYNPYIFQYTDHKSLLATIAFLSLSGTKWSRRF